MVKSWDFLLRIMGNILSVFKHEMYPCFICMYEGLLAVIWNVNKVDSNMSKNERREISKHKR